MTDELVNELLTQVSVLQADQQANQSAMAQMT